MLVREAKGVWSMHGALCRRLRSELVLVKKPAEPVAPLQPHRSRHSRRTVPTQRSACAFAFGAAITPCLGTEYVVETTRELAVAITNQEGPPRLLLVEAHNRLRACCSTQRPVGFGGDACEADAAAAELDKEQHIQSPQPQVSTVKQSPSMIALACWRKNSRQLALADGGAGSTPARRRMFQTLPADSVRPSPTSSPWTRL
jgi:hypothetical protein